MPPKLGDAVVGKNGVAEVVVVVGVGVNDYQRQLGLFPDGGEDLPALAGAATGVDHHGSFRTYNEARVKQAPFGLQHVVVRADFEPC
ncbi:hypothetical protein AHiyo8_47110 [Arthrobacter sp. Hiyo8]|nr:hypothetical protein AHiyo8_47110 [Arthrobacter sp. Hiyo8]